jgi:hypothetical protein
LGALRAKKYEDAFGSWRRQAVSPHVTPSALHSAPDHVEGGAPSEKDGQRSGAKPSLPDARLRDWVDAQVKALDGKHSPSQRRLLAEAQSYFRDHRVTRPQLLRLIKNTPLHVTTPGKRS